MTLRCLQVTGSDRSFQDIMKRYRLQPQAHSHVYRSVSLHSCIRRRRRASGETASGTNSPTTASEDSSESQLTLQGKL